MSVIEIKIGRIEDKIDKLNDKLGSIDVTLGAQHVSLKEHMRRTSILEKAIEPVKKHVARVEGALKLIGTAALIAGIVEGTVIFFDFISRH